MGKNRKDQGRKVCVKICTTEASEIRVKHLQRMEKTLYLSYGYNS